MVLTRVSARAHGCGGLALCDPRRRGCPALSGYFSVGYWRAVSPGAALAAVMPPA